MVHTRLFSAVLCVLIHSVTIRVNITCALCCFCDYEASAVDQGVGWAKDWLDAVYNMKGVKPVIYMSNSVIHRYDWTSVSEHYSLWNAGYYSGYNTIYGFVDNPPLRGSARYLYVVLYRCAIRDNVSPNCTV